MLGHYREMPMRITTLRATAVAITLAIGAGCTSIQTSDPALIEAALKYRPSVLENYVLGAGDEIVVNIWRNPDLSGTVVIRPDGKLSSPLVGDVTASGLTPEQLAQVIRERIGTYVRDPQVSVIVTSTGSYEFRSRVRITGAVERPLSIAYSEGMNVLDAVLSAGGLNDFADGNDAILYRQFQGQTVVIPVRAEDLLKRGDVATNYNLLPGDILTIPEKTL